MNPSPPTHARGARRIALLCRSNEQNGISYHCETLVGLAPAVFVRLNSVLGAFHYLARHRGEVRAIFALSDIEYIIALYLCGRLKLDIPVLLGVFHPRQWESTFDGQTGVRRAALFRRLVAQIPPGNIIASSKETIQRCARTHPHIRGGVNLLLGPLRDYGQPVVRRTPGGPLKVCTIGRYVDFKVATIVALAGIVAQLHAEGMAVEYHIYGEGPSGDELRQAIRALGAEAFIKVHGPIPTTDFAAVVVQHDMFYGMGGAVVQAAMLSVPALIAIQGEKGPFTYGWFADHDHRASPMFGDPVEGAERRTLEPLVREWLRMDGNERADLGRRCKEATRVFEGSAAVEHIERIAACAGSNPRSGVSAWDLLIIRLEGYWIRWTRRKGFHT